MPIEAQLLGLLLASVLAGALIAGLVMRSRVSRAFAAGKADSAPEIERLEAQQATQAETIQNLEKSCHELEMQAAVLESKNERIPGLETEIEALSPGKG